MDIMRKIRSDNLDRLAALPKYGSKAALSRALGYSTPSFLSQITGDSPTARPFSETTAREIEVKLDLPRGWMDVDRSKGPDSAITVSSVTECIQRISKIADEMGVALPPRKFTTIVEMAIERNEDEFIRRLLSLVS